jgi:NADH dehydrogenase FAD-containing subunit
VILYEAECIDIDPEKKQLHCRDVSDVIVKGKENFTVDYDYLIIAVGAISNTFGTAGVKEYCHFLKVTNHHNWLESNSLMKVAERCLRLKGDLHGSFS